jgi:hypothetical protein
MDGAIAGSTLTFETVAVVVRDEKKQRGSGRERSVSAS